jgi:hypothetical protein
VARKIILIVVALVLPGGLIALCGAWALRLLQRKRQVMARARRRATAFGKTLRGPARQAA